MSQALLDHVAAGSTQKQVPVVKTGYTVRVHQRIKEGEKERTQIFEGLVIKVNSGGGVNKNFTVRRIVDGIGVEKIFPFFSQNIEKVEIVKAGKVRRSKLYYMRDRSGKSIRLRDIPVGEVAMMGEEPQPEPQEEPELEVAEASTEEATETQAETEKKEEVKEEPKAEAPAEETAEEAAPEAPAAE